MSIFEFRDYKEFVLKWLAAQPKQGRGLMTRMAESCALSPGMLSQILNGERHFSPETACAVAEFLSLTDEETDYFLLLVQLGRAGTHLLRQRVLKQVQAAQKKGADIAQKLKPDTELTSEAKAIFYSHWLYTGIRNLSACPEFSSVESIAQHLKLPRNVVQKAVDFLLQHGLCVVKKGKLTTGPQITHIGNQTSLVGKHHQNWRLHGFAKMIETNEKNVFFTSPMSLSREAAELVQARIPSFIEEIRKIVGPSESQVVRCLNVDWFEY